MLFNRAKRLLYRSDSVSDEPTVPDPWLTPLPVQKTSAVPEAWHLPLETNPSISPAGSPNAPKLVAHQSTSDEILLEDELKLKTSASKLIKPQLEKALALIYWIETIGQPVVSG